MTVVKMYNFHPTKTEETEKQINEFLADNPHMRVQDIDISISQYNGVAAVVFSGIDNQTQNLVNNMFAERKSALWEKEYTFQ